MQMAKLVVLRMDQFVGIRQKETYETSYCIYSLKRHTWLQDTL